MPRKILRVHLNLDDAQPMVGGDGAPTMYTLCRSYVEPSHSATIGIMLSWSSFGLTLDIFCRPCLQVEAGLAGPPVPAQ